MMWGEFVASAATLLELDNDEKFREMFFSELHFEFGHRLSLPSIRGKPWATGVTGTQPLHVAIDCGNDEIWAAQVFCFATISSLSGVVRVPRDLAESTVDGDVYVAVVRWLEPHATVNETDKHGLPICPGLEYNHALWQYERHQRARLRIASPTDAIRYQLDQAGVRYLRWRQQYEDARFDLVQVSSIQNVLNVALDADTNGLLQTIAMPGTQSQSSITF